MKQAVRLGTFAGVFTPSVLTILGIILFLRLGYVVGVAGLRNALVILVLANSISIISSLSLAAISTNISVKVGGIYYLISRTLGHCFGGAIGIVLFLAQSISIAFYCLGFAEVLSGLLPESPWSDVQVLASLSILVLFFFAWLGADWATRFQYGVMAVLFAALCVFFYGSSQSWSVATLRDNWQPSAEYTSFWLMFALFFPAVTGFTQGVSMSGDLKTPSVSIPKGTFYAVFISSGVYFAAIFAFAGAMSQSDLINSPNPMSQVATEPLLITAGVFAASLSSAMASFLGAPRILQSLAGDRLWKFLLPFAQTGLDNNPRRGVMLSAVIALLTVLFGQLNMIAPVVSMFFLISYGLINFATYVEARSDSPSFRPTFRGFNKQVSFIGTLLCFGAMLAIHVTAGLVALAILIAIYFYLRNTGMRSRWADGWRSFHLLRVREHLMAARREPEHPRDWRPNILLFPMQESNEALFQFALLLETQCGFMTAVKIILGKGAELIPLKKQQEQELKHQLHHYQLQAFPLVVSCRSAHIGIHTLIQAHGIGPLKANTVLMPWVAMPNSHLQTPRHSYVQHLKAAIRLHCNLLVLVESTLNPVAIPEQAERIDIWWSDDASSHLALLLAYLIQRSEGWDKVGLRVIYYPCSGRENTLEQIKAHLHDLRIPADVFVIESFCPHSLSQYSAQTDLVFFPFRLHQDQFLTPDGQPLESFLKALPTTILTLASQDFELESEPETGLVAEIAEIFDEVENARDLCRYFQQRLNELQAQQDNLLDLKSPEGLAIANELEKLTRRYAKVKTRLQAAEKKAVKIKIES